MWPSMRAGLFCGELSLRATRRSVRAVLRVSFCEGYAGNGACDPRCAQAFFPMNALRVARVAVRAAIGARRLTLGQLVGLCENGACGDRRAHARCRVNNMATQCHVIAM